MKRLLIELGYEETSRWFEEYWTYIVFEKSGKDKLLVVEDVEMYELYLSFLD